MTTTAPAPSATEASAPTAGGRSLLVSGARATGLALVAVLAVHGLSLAVGTDLLVAGPDGAPAEVATDMVAGMTVLGGAVALLLAWAARRWAPRPRTAFVVTTVVGVLAYAGVPFAAAESLSTALWLNLYHVAVAVPLVALFGRELPRVRDDATA